MPRPLPTIAGVVRCSVIGNTPSGRKWTNVHHMEYADGASTPGTVELDALDVDLFRFYNGTAYSGGFAVFTICSPSVTMLQIDYTVLDATALLYTKTHNVAASGNVANLPSEVSAVLTLRTNTRGRRYRGRIYLPPMATSNIDNAGLWNTAMRNGIIAQYTGMQVALLAKQWRPVVASYGYSWIDDPSDVIPPSGHSPKVLSTWTPFATRITAVTMDAKPDVQRRRK